MGKQDPKFYLRQIYRSEYYIIITNTPKSYPLSYPARDTVRREAGELAMESSPSYSISSFSLKEAKWKGSRRTKYEGSSQILRSRLLPARLL